MIPITAAKETQRRSPKCNGNVTTAKRRSGYRTFGERVEDQYGALDTRALLAGLADWDDVTIQEFDDLPFINKEASQIKEELRFLLRQRSQRGAIDETEIDQLFDQIRNAAITLELDFEEEQVPVAPRHYFRPALKRLKQYPSGLNRIFEDVDDENLQRKRMDQRELLALGATLIDRESDGNWYPSLQSSPQLLTEVIDALLTFPVLSDSAGREHHHAIDDYTGALRSVYRSASGREAGRSVSNNESRFDDYNVNKSGIPGGPAVRFIRLCLEPFNRKINDGVIAELIRKPRRRAKNKKE